MDALFEIEVTTFQISLQPYQRPMDNGGRLWIFRKGANATVYRSDQGRRTPSFSPPSHRLEFSDSHNTPSAARAPTPPRRPETNSITPLLPSRHNTSHPSSSSPPHLKGGIDSFSAWVKWISNVLGKEWDEYCVLMKRVAMEAIEDLN
ncbi:Hypothetical predicted protein [Prunus dulcis]|uniref:Uncharacterized protein n=1 Tax=Prunus dulcis TaxID=3755 RepID=A0A5E4EVX3_PRUDU|nr:Hypothetical predicted protein [Prunus dulcis]